MISTPDLTLSNLRRRYLEGSLAPRDLIKDTWERVMLSDPRIWISRPDWNMLERMVGSLEKRDASTLPLYGIPFAIKDNIDWAGMPTTAACPAFSHVPVRSSFVVDRLIAAGAIPIGKTNLDQFATGLVGVRSPYGVPPNPFDETMIPGGSSSGSAVAVALGLASFSLGTDTAGSGRVPASCNNLVGVKPTCGVLSTSGVVPACRTLDCVSIFALTCEDALHVFEAAAARDPEDPFSRESAASRPRDLNSIEIGIPRQDQLQFFGNERARDLFKNTLQHILNLGWRVREIDFQSFFDAARLLYEGPWVAERYAAIEPLLQSNPEALLPVTRSIISQGADHGAVSVFKAQYRLAELRRDSELTWNEVDAVMTPTVGTTYSVAEVEADPIRLNSNLGIYTNFMNLFDLSAWAVPAGFLEAGLPWGVTFFAPAQEDRFLAFIASKFHAALDLPVGTTALRSAAVPQCKPSATLPPKRWIKIAVCGAHMEGLPLNHQLTSRHGRFVTQSKTAAVYRLYLLPGSGAIPDRPGLVRVAKGGAPIEFEIWELPEETVGSFVDAVPAPLGLGRVLLPDGGTVCGFLCEAHAVSPEHEITQHGGWRSWLAVRDTGGPPTAMTQIQDSQSPAL